MERREVIGFEQKGVIPLNAKEYLLQYTDLARQIVNKAEEIQRLETLVTKVNTPTDSSDRVKSSGNQDKMADAVCKIADLQTELQADITRMADLQDEIKQTISKVSNTEHRDVLYKRYILNMTWERIAVELNVSYRHTTRLHGIALQEVEKIIKDVLECPT